jgi:hypothetical protein
MFFHSRVLQGIFVVLDLWEGSIEMMEQLPLPLLFPPSLKSGKTMILEVAILNIIPGLGRCVLRSKLV